MKKKVFLGGTCNGSDWRDVYKKHLNIRYFDPVVDNWDTAARIEEERQKNECDYLLYTITPKIKGVYTIAELVRDSMRNTEKTVLSIITIDDDIQYGRNMLNSILAVKQMVESIGIVTFVDSPFMVMEYFACGGIEE